MAALSFTFDALLHPDLLELLIITQLVLLLINGLAGVTVCTLDPIGMQSPITICFAAFLISE